MSDPDPSEKSIEQMWVELCSPKYELDQWLSDVRASHERNLKQCRLFYSHARHIDSLFQRLINGWRLNVFDIMLDHVHSLIYRAHAAFLTSVVLVLNGQVVDAHSVLR